VGPRSTTTRARSRALGYLGAVAFCALAAPGLAACGGGSGPSTQAPSGTSGANATAPSTTTGTTAKTLGASHSSSRSTAKRQGSAPFRVKVGDNSIPDFGSEAATAERARAALALTGYLRARAESKWSAACTYIARPVRAQLEKLLRASKDKVKGCAAALSALSAKSPPAARVDVFTHGLAALRSGSGHGFALFYGAHRQQYVIPMASEAGTWRVTQLAPIPYPLDAQTQGSQSQNPTSPQG